ncbi:MAG: DUF1847 domain-containing protein [Deltaproteobacteria bacterium]|nr:DUF1847 domain-containing protein [Deltaproteobacteria bacterium]
MNQENCDCARCPIPRSERSCEAPLGLAPAGCPTEIYQELNQKALSLLAEPLCREFARQAACQEKEGYRLEEGHTVPIKPRLLEIAEFAGRMGYRKLGLAFCSGLYREGKKVAEFLVGRDFEVVSACCKVGRTPKEELGLDDGDKLHPGRFEPMCNPLLQALLLNEAKTEFNILLGLCVGHDSLFFRHGQAPCTVLAVKDRLLGHNPLAAVYQLDSYYRCLSHR